MAMATPAARPGGDVVGGGDGGGLGGGDGDTAVTVDAPVSLLLSPKLAPAFSALGGALKARMRAADDSCFFKGDRVRLINLKGRSDLNGCEGEILTGDPSSSQEDMRYAVRVLRGAAAEEILVRPKNMIDWLEESSSAPAEAPPAVQTARTAAAEGFSSSQPAPSSSLPAAAPAAAAAVAAPAAPAAAAAAVAAVAAPAVAAAPAAAAPMASSGGSKAAADAQPKSPAKGAAKPSSEPSAGEKLGEKQQPRLRKDGVSVIEQIMTRHRGGLHSPNPNRIPKPTPDPNPIPSLTTPPTLALALALTRTLTLTPTLPLSPTPSLALPLSLRPITARHQAERPPRANAASGALPQGYLRAPDVPLRLRGPPPPANP